MQLSNETPFVAGWVPGFHPDGRELVTVVVKGSFSLRNSRALHSRPQPLLEVDEFGADPARDAPVRENDFAPLKLRCDVLVHATAYAPGGRATTGFDVGVAVGQMTKRLHVTGPRQWRRGLTGVTATAPERFVEHRISYDTAFGGVDVDPERPDVVNTFLENPSGLGFSKSGCKLSGMALPRTEEMGRPVTDPAAHYKPQALGPIGRNWVPRSSYVGTYDKAWQDERMPFMPDDFNPLHYQAAAPDQQIDPPVGGERIVLANLLPEGHLQSEIPSRGVVVSFITHAGEFVEQAGVCDGVTIEPDQDLLALTWRATLALPRDFFDLREIVVTESSAHSTARTRSRALRKTFYAGLGALVADRRRSGA